MVTFDDDPPKQLLIHVDVNSAFKRLIFLVDLSNKQNSARQHMQALWIRLTPTKPITKEYKKFSGIKGVNHDCIQVQPFAEHP